MRVAIGLHNVALDFGRKVRPKSRMDSEDHAYEILLTGKFYADNWIFAHLEPLAASTACKQVVVVSCRSIPSIAKVVAIYPPRWLVSIAGPSAARVLIFIFAAIVRRPDILGGFHLKMNALVASVVAPFVGARSLYFCVGGRTEALDGGIWGESHFFERMETPDSIVEKRLLHAVAGCDWVITMGTGAIDFFRRKGIKANFHVVSGGIDSTRFVPTHNVPLADVILVGRLVEVKRVDVFLQAVRLVMAKMPQVKALIVGDGGLRDTLHGMASDIGLNGQVRFVGHQESVTEWLTQSKVFVLTSDSEGLSLALMEAMMCGLPAVVSRVGDLPDLVEDGVNGFLVPRRSPEIVAERLMELLMDEQKYHSFSVAARLSACRYELEKTSRHWDEILGQG
jgi:glycosyltransferase involved in cell wall biosynthesis